MGDISIIARRLSDEYVQHGWSGNGGYYGTVGLMLLEWYNTPEMVEYLFGLGQVSMLWAPHSEEGTDRIKTRLTGQPHWVDPSERSIFSKIAFIDYGYFYDADHRWYYVVPGPFRIKMPLELVAANLDEKGFEFDFRRDLQRRVFDRVLERCRTDPAIQEKLAAVKYDLKCLEDLEASLSLLPVWKSPLEELWDKHRAVFNCFDDWVVIRADESRKTVGEIILKPKQEKHIETIFW